MTETRETPETVAPEETDRKLQIRLSEDAYKRIHAAAGRQLVNPGKIVNDLAIAHLPASDAA